MCGVRVNKIIGSVAIVLSIFVLVGSAAAQSNVADFYRGKQVRFISGYSAGGLFDSATRIMARHVGKFIPGNPNIWVDNMTGAGGLIATNYVAKAAPKDGTVLLNLDGALLRLQAFNNPSAQFDARQFNWLSSPAPDLQVCWVGKESGWTSITQALGGSKELKLGGLAPGTFPSDTARILQEALGIKIKLVDGFKGVSEVRIATESNEVDGSCSSYEGVTRAFPKELQAGDIQVIVQIGETSWPGLEKVANAMDLAKSERAKRLSSRCRHRSQRHQSSVYAASRRAGRSGRSAPASFRCNVQRSGFQSRRRKGPLGFAANIGREDKGSRFFVVGYARCSKERAAADSAD